MEDWRQSVPDVGTVVQGSDVAVYDVCGTAVREVE